MPRIPEHLPEAFHDALRRAPGMDADGLRRQIYVHQKQVEAALKTNEFVDEATARDLARVSRALLDMQLPEAQRLLAFAAIDYFIQDDDAIPDFESPIGFDDDVEVMN